jgi:hypothetical protein
MHTQEDHNQITNKSINKLMATKRGTQNCRLSFALYVICNRFGPPVGLGRCM